MSNPRRLAHSACSVCRRRKQKCDELRPTCGRCAKLGVPCAYRSNTPTPDAPRRPGASLPSDAREQLDYVREQLDRLETKVDFLQRGLATPTCPAALATDVEASPTAPQPSVPTPSTIPMRVENDLAIPLHHSSAAQNFFMWPCSPLRLDRYDPYYTLRLEMNRPKLTRHQFPPRCLRLQNQSGDPWIEHLSLSQFRQLERSFFALFQPLTMLVDEHAFRSYHAPLVLQDGFGCNLSSCLVLFVLAVGAIGVAAGGDAEWTCDDDPLVPRPQQVFHTVGLSFFYLADQAIDTLNTSSWIGVQCLLVKSLYHSLQLRLYDQWHSVNQACMTVMLLLRLGRDLSPAESQIFWAAYSQESQILAEFDLPPSGISRFENSVPLQSGMADEDADGDGIDGDIVRAGHFYFLAQISLRRLLNRVHFNMYNEDPQIMSSYSHLQHHQPPSASPRLVQELDHQLENWRAHLPTSLQFDVPAWDLPLHQSDDETSAVSVYDRMRNLLQARYYSTKSLIHRTHLYYALLPENDHNPAEQTLGARIVLSATYRMVSLMGLHREQNLYVLPSLLNVCRGFLAAAVQRAFSYQRKDILEPASDTPDTLFGAIRNRLLAEVAPFSPVLSRDLELLLAISHPNTFIIV